MTEHSGKHDGIVEHDNHLPKWWLLTLFGSIAFSLGYWFYYETFAVGLSSQAALAAEEAGLKAERPVAPSLEVSDEALLAASRDPQVVARGREVFAANCAACHQARGEGNIGPNLTDAYWLHGAKPTQIYNVISHGVLDKGMLAWGQTLGAAKVQDVAAFVLTLKNTNVAGKAPQGEKEN